MSTDWPPGPGFWADEFPAQTTNRTTPFLFKGVIPAPAANADMVLDGFAAIRAAHQNAMPISAHARVYVGEERRDDLLGTALEGSGWQDGYFVGWMQDLINASRFSLVINNLETVSPPLAAGLGAFVQALMHGWGVPIGAAEQVAFVGNYSGTAFGVHEGFEDAFLTHYGPGIKHFYTWSADDYAKLTGGTQPLYGDYTWLLDHGQHWQLEPGDALFLPRRVFHVGRQTDFSVSVAVPVYTYPDTTILRQSLLPQLFDALLSTDPDSAQGQPSPMAALTAGFPAVAQRLAALATATLAAAADQIEDATTEHMRHRWNTILSNGGWELVADDLGRTNAVNAFDPSQVAAGAQVAVTPPYQLIASGNEAFLRGCVVPADPAVLTNDLVTALNAGPVTLPDDDSLLTVIRALGTTGGLTITAPDRQEVPT